jgi:NodT family efflux transporter outer membrane factor (OMF) lipoprotein
MKKYIIQTLLLISVGALFSSCGIYNKYSRPDMELATDNLYRGENVTTDTTNFGNLGWRELFTDPALQSLIEQGLANNVNVRIANLAVSQAEAALKVARLSHLPTFNFVPDGSVSKFKDAPNVYTYSAPVAASWEIDVFGKVTNAKRRTKALYEQSKEYEQAVQTRLIATIANVYYTLLMLDNQLEISETTATSWKDIVSTMEALKASGMANDAAVSQMQATYYAIEASLFELRRQIYEVENSLALLLGDTPTQIQRGKLFAQSLPAQLAIGIPIQQLANRPDVKSAELALQQAFYATAEARAAFYPSLVLNGSAGWTNTVGNVIINPGGLLFAAAGSLVQPIFNHGGVRANYKISQAAQEQARLAFRQSVLNAGTEVINALKQVETAHAKSDFRQKQIASLERTVKSTELLMRHGSSTYLEVLTANQTLLSAQLAESADRFDEIQGVVNLYCALGGGRR